jgi:hypothetical protein
VPETGHWISGEILAAYLSTENYQDVYGYPITEAFNRSAAPGEPEITYQYFERARFEFRPNQPAEIQVTLSPLGVFLYDAEGPGQTVPVAPGLPECRYFTETNFPVCYSFLEYFEGNGGIGQFGYPISEIETHDGRMVQYFQRARFEWHPEMAVGKRVVLTDVGRIYFDQVNEDPHLLLPPKGNLALQDVSDLSVQAFVEKAVLASDEQQTLYVIVQDQSSQPISSALVAFTVKFPNGEQSFIMPLTDANGIATLTFPIAGQGIGVNEIRVTVDFDNHQKETVTSYRVWW